MAAHWEEAHCPLCPPDAPAHEFLVCSDRLREPLLRNYRLVKCSGCGLIYLNPRPVHSGVEGYGGADYDPFVSVAGPRGLTQRLFAAARHFTLAWKRNLVKRLVPLGGRVLDVGCGTGEFLAALKPEYSTAGIEPEPTAAQWARERLGLNVVTGTLAEAGLSETGFDLITFWHVLEHLPEPVQGLREAANRLAVGGRILVALPNPRSFDARIYGAEWVAWDAPRHLWHFSAEHIHKAATAAGLKVLRRRMLPLDGFYNVWWSERLKAAVGGAKELMVGVIRAPVGALGTLAWGMVSGRHSGCYYLLERN